MTNDGSIVSSIDIPAKDGLVLLRPLQLLTGAPFVNGAFARVLKGDGTPKRNGFFSYLPSHKGGVKLLVTDLNHDGSPETVRIDATTITVSATDGSVRSSFMPLSHAWSGGFSIATVDLDGDGGDEILASPAQSLKKGFGKSKPSDLGVTSSKVMAFDPFRGMLTGAFEPFGGTFAGGLSIAARTEQGRPARIAVGAGKGSPPRVRLFDGSFTPLGPEFRPYSSKFRGGVSVALARLSPASETLIVTAPGSGIEPRVRVVDARGRDQRAAFLAFDKRNKNGVSIAASDLDGDGLDEIIPMTTTLFTLSSLSK